MTGFSIFLTAKSTKDEIAIRSIFVGAYGDTPSFYYPFSKVEMEKIYAFIRGQFVNCSFA